MCSHDITAYGFIVKYFYRFVECICMSAEAVGVDQVDSEHLVLNVLILFYKFSTWLHIEIVEAKASLLGDP
jgi:hypothetical protein